MRYGGTALGRRVPGGILIGDAGAYDRLSGFLLGSLYGSIAADVASVVPAGGRVLEVGCGPGHLSIRLADQHGFDVTGLDLDPVMIERARAKVAHGSPGDERRPAFVVGDAAVRWPGSASSVRDDATARVTLDAECGRTCSPRRRAVSALSSSPAYKTICW